MNRLEKVWGYLRGKKNVIHISLLVIAVYALIFVCIHLNGTISGNSILKVKKGEFISSDVSPDGDYHLNAYVYSGGATADYYLTVEVVASDFKRNIYRNYRESTVDIEWVSNYECIINGHDMDVRYHTFDWRADFTEG